MKQNVSSAQPGARSVPPGTGSVIEHHEEVMGTVVSFVLADARSAGAAIKPACEELHRIDEVFSTFKPNSAVSRLRRGELDASELPDDVAEVLNRCVSARELTDGWFDPWAMPGGIDPSGLVKGWAVERAAAILRANGVRSALVNGGGDVACFGAPPQGGPWRIGIHHPWRADAFAAIVECDAGAVATSGTYERGEHLIDPHTGTPHAALASATVIGPDLGLADALATALAVAGPGLLRRVRALTGYEAHLVEWNGTEHTTPGTRLAAPS